MTAIYLVHGTFVGADALGILREISRVWPTAGDVLRRIQKQAVDHVTRYAGNFTVDYARQLQNALQGDHPAPIPVKLFLWSSENHHIGRADGAVRLLAELADEARAASDGSIERKRRDGERILFCGHSHGGNVLALITNLLANDTATNDRFFSAARPYYCWPGTQRIDISVWPHVAEMLRDTTHPLRDLQLDMVTMGAPIRYGWDTSGCANLLHFVNHHCDDDTPEYLARFPATADDILQATWGDVVQHFGIAGTNFAPPLWAWRASLADRALGALLQAGVRRRDLLKRLHTGCRVPADGTTLLVDYGPSVGHLGQHLAGHAVYTQIEWQRFHFEQIASHFYGWEAKP